MTAKEFWKEKFDEYPQTDADKLAVTMMAEYGGHIALQLAQQMEDKNVVMSGLTESCDVCGCHPSIIITTEYGRFCTTHVKYTK